jgi:hypothetical protein
VTPGVTRPCTLLVQSFDADITSILSDQNSGPGLAANAIPKDPITTLLEKLRTCGNQLSRIDKDFDCFRDQFSDELRRYIASQQISLGSSCPPTSKLKKAFGPIWLSHHQDATWKIAIAQGGQNWTLHLLAVPTGNRTLVLANAETYPTQYRARFSNLHWLLFGGLQDWSSCHLRKENFRVGATARWRKDTEEYTPSLRRTFYSDRTRATVDVKSKFLGMYS